MNAALSLILAGFGIFAGPAPGHPDRANPLRACLESRAARDEFSGAVLIAERGRIVWQAGYGYADAARTIRNTPATRFNIASTGKMFTAVAIAQLVEAGRLRFDDPIGRHLPGLPPDIAAITVDQLLTHRSGLRDYFRPQNRAAIAAAQTVTDLLPLALADGLAFAPGSDQAYSSSGFVVLGAIVERLSGLSYSEYLRRHIFRPAGMTATSLDGTAPRATAMTRRDPGGGEAQGPLHPAPQIGSLWGTPAGGATSTVGDMFRFAEALRRHRLLRAQTTEILWRAQAVSRTQNAEGRSSYGYGFTRLDIGTTRFVGHGGGSIGVNAQLEIDPERGRIAVALANYDPPSATEAVRAAQRAWTGNPAVCG